MTVGWPFGKGESRWINKWPFCLSSHSGLEVMEVSQEGQWESELVGKLEISKQWRVVLLLFFGHLSIAGLNRFRGKKRQRREESRQWLFFLLATISDQQGPLCHGVGPGQYLNMALIPGLVDWEAKLWLLFLPVAETLTLPRQQDNLLTKKWASCQQSQQEWY